MKPGGIVAEAEAYAVIVVSIQASLAGKLAGQLVLLIAAVGTRVVAVAYR